MHHRTIKQEKNDAENQKWACLEERAKAKAVKIAKKRLKIKQNAEKCSAKREKKSSN